MKPFAYPVRLMGLLALAGVAAAHTSDAYTDSILKWRTEREAGLKAERGWLSVAGLFWLKDGANTIGSDATNDIILPAAAPAKLGTLQFESGTVKLTLAENTNAMVDGQVPTPGQVLKADVTGSPNRVTVGSLTFNVIQRGQRTGIRLYDQNAPSRVGFSGCKWYPVDPAYRIKASFTAYLPPTQIPITNVLGDTSMETCLGEATFVLNGKKCTLEALDDDEGLFFNIHDATSGDTTYSAGRFLYTGKPKNGYVEIDFNRAENPPCAFTAFATCPLPPKKNFLPVAILAGEKVSGPRH